MPSFFVKAALQRLMVMPLRKAIEVEEWDPNASEKAAAVDDISSEQQKQKQNDDDVAQTGTVRGEEVQRGSAKLLAEIAAIKGDLKLSLADKANLERLLLHKDEELAKKDLEIVELRRRLSRRAEDEAGVGWDE